MDSDVDLKFEAGPGDRLGFVLSSEPVFSARLRALLAVGVVALSFGAAAVSVASETDADQEGVSTQPGAPTDQVGDGSAEETPLPIEVVPVVVDPDQEPSDPHPDSGPPTSVPLEEVAPSVLPPAEPAPAPPTAPPVAAPPVTPAPRADARQGKALVVEQAVPPTRQLRVSSGDQDREREAAPGSHGEPDGPQAAPTASSAAPATHSVSIRRGRRFYVVRPGDSLWSIASALRGPGASVAAVAREVRRLWKLNRHRIGTDDPDLLPTAVQLRLRRWWE